MARRCDVTGTGPMTGHSVSHANNRTPRRFLPNVQEKRIWVPELGRFVRVKITAKALKTLTKKGTSEIARLVQSGKLR